MHTSVLLETIRQHSGLSKPDFIRKLGYRNVTKGLRKYDQALQSGKVSKPLIQTIGRIFQVPSNVFDEAVRDAHSVKGMEDLAEKLRIEIEQRKQFRPFLWILTRKQSSSVITSMVTNGRRKIMLPAAVLLADREKALEDVRQIILIDFKRREGNFPPLGNIVGYRFVRSYDESLVFDVNGKLLTEESEKFLEPVAYFTLRR